MLRTHARFTRLLAVVFFTLIAGFSGAGSFTATAQDTATPEPDLEHINVAALLCLDLDCMEFGDRLDGFEISVVNLETGEALDTCVTQADTQMQTCVLEFPADIPWEFAWDASQTPDGYRPYRYSHIVVEGGPVSPVYYIPFVPIDAQGPNDIVVQAALCTDASCDEYAGFLDDFVITAVDSDSRVTVSECTTGNAEQGLEHQCILGMPAKGTVDIEWDGGQVPAGYEWFGSLIHVADGPDGTSTTIPFVPVEIQKPGHLVVQTALCTDSTCDEFAEMLDEFLISAVDPETGEKFSECMTDNLQQNLDHQCILDVPADGVFELTWFEDQVPDGYVAFREPIVSDAPIVTTLAFYPESEATVTPTTTPEAVTTLPTTGIGAKAAADHPRPLGLAMATALVLLVLGSACYRAVTHRNR